MLENHDVLKEQSDQLAMMLFFGETEMVPESSCSSSPTTAPIL